ncbi:MAG: DNA primase [Deltaproteobacteria bacterium]|nr:DNA primase [Deltaproteobacteria bacterium]
MGTIAEDKIEQVRDRADILAIIGKRVQLKRTGRSWVGLCPFHNERSPSFNVMPDRGFYHCFGCQASGDVFKFIMETEHQPFPTVVRDLAKELGIEIVEHQEAPEEKQAREKREWLYKVNDYVNQFFVHQLWNSGDAKHARAYVEKRGITEETAKTFAMGYAPRRADSLIAYLEAKRVPVAAAVELGVVGERDDKSMYLRFFDRVMFPIYDEKDRIAGFGGRVLDPDAKAAKYLNSPESPIFKKSRLLYGYSKAKNSIARKGGAWLCEGYLDVIALHQAGLDQAIAPLGTAVTPDHLPLLRRVSQKAYTLFDGDAAGMRATRKTTELLLAHGFSVYVVAIPDGDDPDTLVLREGREAVEKRVQTAPAAVQFFVQQAAQLMQPSVEGRVQAAGDLAPLLAKIPAGLERDLYVREAAQRLGIEEDMLRRFFGRKTDADGRPGGTANRPVSQAKPASQGWAQLTGDAPSAALVTEPEQPKVTPPDSLEFAPTLELLKYRAAWDALPKAVELISHEGLRRLVASCIEDADAIDFATMRVALGSEAMASNFSRTLSEDRSPDLDEKARERLVEDVLLSLQHYLRQREKTALKQALLSTPDVAEQQALLHRIKELNRWLKQEKPRRRADPGVESGTK